MTKECRELEVPRKVADVGILPRKIELARAEVGLMRLSGPLGTGFAGQVRRPSECCCGVDDIEV